MQAMYTLMTVIMIIKIFAQMNTRLKTDLHKTFKITLIEETSELTATTVPDIVSESFITKGKYKTNFHW